MTSSSNTSSTFALLPITQPWVERSSRQRAEIETDDLQQSIKRLGLLQPIVVRRSDNKLMAGERRWEACKALGWANIPVQWLESLSELEAEEVELAENIKRKALPWQDEVRAVAKIYKLHKEKDPELSQEAFGLSLGVSQTHIARIIRISQDLGEERIAKAGSVYEASNILARRNQRAAGAALEELLGLTYEAPRQEEAPGPQSEKVRSTPTQVSTTPVSNPSTTEALPLRAAVSPIQCASFLDWLKIPQPHSKFNFIHCDFPYGINLFSSQQGRGSEPTQGYEDEAEVYFQLLDAFCTNLDSFMAMSGHLMFWFSAKHRIRTMETFHRLCPSLIFYPYDLIWHKSDNAGIAGDHRRHPRHTYEQALLATRGGRNIIQVVADSYAAPTQKTLHPSCKPEPMLRHFFQMFVDKESRVFDPTCGAGSSIRAANSLGATQLLGLEIDPGMAEIAQREYRLRCRE